MTHAYQAVFEDALERMDKAIPLSPVQAVIIREWLIEKEALKNRLELKLLSGSLSTEEELLLRNVSEIFTKYGSYR